jgi:SAM-dependent methyltransferase
VQAPDRANKGFEFQRVDPDRIQLPYKDDSVDVALLFDVLEHVRDPRKLVAEIGRVVRPGGLLIAFIPVEGEKISWYTLFRAVFGQDLYAVTKDHIQAFRHSEVEDVIGQHFHIQNRNYAYHPLGQLMDAFFFALLKVSKLNRLFLTETSFRTSGDRPRSLAARCFGGVLEAANSVAWAESKLLFRVRLGCSGILLTARPRTLV